jgi:Domain of unknown function (DUF4833)
MLVLGRRKRAGVVGLGIGLGIGIGLLATPAVADEVAFGPHDVATVFFISKSDDHNRVDYGIHLDAHCAPLKDEAVYQYWREFENSPPVRVHTLGAFEYIAYGISEQHTVQKTPAGGVHTIKLRQLEKRPVEIITTRGADGRCLSQARTVINGKESEFTFVFVKLSGGFIVPSVDYVDVHGRDLQTSAEVVERMRR